MQSGQRRLAHRQTRHCASGNRVICYGMTHDLMLGVEVAPTYLTFGSSCVTSLGEKPLAQMYEGGIVARVLGGKKRR